jgi:NAD(P)H-hydrate epimerase
MKYENVFLSASSVKEADGRAAGYGITSFMLMDNAGRELLRYIEEYGADTSSVIIMCGRGGNGGNGYSLACRMRERGINVRVVCTAPPKNTDSVAFMERFLNSGGEIIRFAEDSDTVFALFLEATLVVDSFHGAAFNGELRGDELKMVEWCNASTASILAVDIPTGVSADGRVLPNCVDADFTVTFTSHKAATVSYPALDYCGKVYVADIGVPDEVLKSLRPSGCIIDENVLSYLPERAANTNKGSFGTLLAFVGSRNMPGAAYLSSLAALRAGVGLLKVTSDDDTLAVLKNRLAEPVFVPLSEESVNEQKYSALLAGCGLGRDNDDALGWLLKRQNQITIIDADGINYLASHINVLMEMQGDIILTPHPGEMARLIGADTEYVNSNRIECARAFAMEYCCVVVLKGANTVIASPNGDIFVNTTGNSALAKGGSGDVLAGVIASLAAQGVTPLKAACIGAYVHGRAADEMVSELGVRGLLPHDLPAQIGRLLG